MSEGVSTSYNKEDGNIKTMMTELKWFLKGDTNIRYLVQNGYGIVEW